MKKRHSNLGMDKAITRRDMLHGIGSIAGVAMIPGLSLADAVLAQERAADLPYPPTHTGMRGNHDGSWEVAHALAREGQVAWGTARQADKTLYDLVVVGAGISGLAAAYLWLEDHPKDKILILDNHDDFGGHAKRNEFDVNGKTVIGYGGSQTMQEPASYPAEAKELLRNIGVNLSLIHI